MADDKDLKEVLKELKRGAGGKKKVNNTAHCTVYTLHTAYCTLYTLYCTLYTVLYTVQCTHC